MASEEPTTPAIETRLHWARSANPSPEDMRKNRDDEEVPTSTNEKEEEKEEVVEGNAMPSVAKEDTEIISAVSQVIASVRSSHATGYSPYPPPQATSTAAAENDSRLAIVSHKLKNIKRKLSDLAAEVEDVTRTLDGDDASLHFLPLPENKRRRVKVERVELEKPEEKSHLDQLVRHYLMPQTPTHGSASPNWWPTAEDALHPIIQSGSFAPMFSAASRNLQPTSPQSKSQGSSVEEHLMDKVLGAALQEGQEMEEAGEEDIWVA